MKLKAEIEQGLAQLPRKTAMVFRKLWEAGQIGDTVLATVLIAAKLSGDHHRLLGFTISYLQMNAHGVPVCDAIRMAKAQNRRINLGWSVKRWRLEHGRLSQTEALARLGAENVVYDVERFERHLPANFTGYLIRTSRRLGMEGLRQRHCVASYHNSVKNGQCAIASVFLDRRRWTVELVTTDDPGAPLRIAQIKTQLNGAPTPAERARIHDLLGIRLPSLRQSEPASQGRQFSYIETLRTVLPVLRDCGVNFVTVYFNGCGDEGAIDDFVYVPNSFDGKDVTVEYVKATRRFCDGDWITTQETVNQSVQTALADLTYDYLVETGVDWYKDDGGFGKLEIDVALGTVLLDVDVRHTESSNAYHREWSIATGEDV